jgi:hypothetical protein
MLKIAFGTVICAALCFGSAAAFAQPPGHAKRGVTAEKKSDKALLEQAVDEVLGRQDAEHTTRQRQNPNSNAQWLPDAKRGQARAAERRPAHAGPRHARGKDVSRLLDQLLGEDERVDRAKSKREKNLSKIRKQKRPKTDAPDDRVGVFVEKTKTDKTKTKN